MSRQDNKSAGAHPSAAPIRVAIIGAGAAGLAAAYDLIKAGQAVTVYEAGNQVGGLAGGFTCPHWSSSVEKFYHHWFASDHSAIQLIHELQLGDKLVFHRPVSSVYHAGKFYPFDSAMAWLRFPGLEKIDRIRNLLVGGYLKALPRWQDLEKYTAHEWLLKHLGSRAYGALWQPLIEGKFGPELSKEVNMAWFWARIHARTPKLGTFQGGFQAFYDLFANKLKQQGVTVALDTPVRQVRSTGPNQFQVETDSGTEKFDAVICTTSPGNLMKLAPGLPSDYGSKLQAIRTIGAVVVVLALKHSLSPGIYWHNLPKKDGFPFLVMVEHTNFASPADFGGEHIVYCGDYLYEGHEYYSLSKEQLLERFLPSLAKFNPDFSKEWIQNTWMFRTSYAQPVLARNHSHRLPPMRTPLEGLYLADMSQIYPWDRSTSFSTEVGRRAAGMILSRNR